MLSARGTEANAVAEGSGTGALRQMAINEPDAGSDATRMTTRFAPDWTTKIVVWAQNLHHQRRCRRSYLLLANGARYETKSSDKDGRKAISALF